MTEPISTAIATGAIAVGSNIIEKNFVDFIDMLCGGKISISKATNSAKAEIESEKIRTGWTLRDKPKFEKLLHAQLLKAEQENINLNSTIEKAKPLIKPEQSSEQKNVDNLRLILNEAEQISDENMQDYIAAILAQEYNQPNTISRFTINIVKSLTKIELEIFAKYAAICWTDFILTEYFNLSNSELFTTHGYSYEELQMLQALGLFNASNSTSKNFNFPRENYLLVTLNSQNFCISKIENTVLSDLYTLSHSGQELRKFVNSQASEDYIIWSISRLAEKGLHVSQLLEKPKYN